MFGAVYRAELIFSSFLGLTHVADLPYISSPTTRWTFAKRLSYAEVAELVDALD